MGEVAISRRGFLKAAALTGCAAAMGASMSGSLVDTDKAYAESGPTRKMIKTCCHGCIQVCPVRAYVEDGVVVKLEGDPDAPISKGGLCTKGLNQLHTMYSPRRILHPLKRAGERGENKWEVISWDEALSYAAQKFSDSIDKYGNYSIVVSTGGGGAYEFWTCMTLAYSFKSPNSFEPGNAQCYVPRQGMAEFMYGGADQSMADSAVMEPFNDYVNATTSVVLWGTQPSASQVSQAGRGMADARDRGVRTVVIDPNFSADAAKADVWLPIRPASDTGLLLSWIKYIIDNEKYDEDFCRYWTNLPFLIDPDTKMPILAQEIDANFKKTTPEDTPDYVCYDLRTNSVKPFVYSLPEDSSVTPELFGEHEVTFADGKVKSCKTAFQIYREEADPWTLEKAAENCWLRVDDIKKALDIYTEDKVSGICNGVFGDQTALSSQITQGCLSLDMMMGYVNKPGATLTQKPCDFRQGLMASKHAGKRPFSNNSMMAYFGKTYGIGANVGHSEAENRADYENFEQKDLQALSKDLILDRLGMDKYRGLYFSGMAHIPAVHEAMDTGEPYRPRCWYDFSGNKLMALGDAGSWIDTIANMDFICCQYPNLTSFHIEAADLIFPTQEWLEYSGSDRTGQLNANFMRTNVVHIGETAHPDTPAYHLLEKVEEINPGSVERSIYFGDGTAQASRDFQANVNFGAKDWDDLVNNQDKYVPAVTPIEDFWKYDQHREIVDDGLPAGFATESRKCEVYCTLMLRMSRTGYPFTYPFEMEPCPDGDYSPICTHVEPAESPLDDTEYPLVITSGRVPYFHHGTMRHAAFARELFPTAECRINPDTAAKYGIEHMDWVNVSSRRGTVSARAYLTEGVAPGMLWMERFWNPECFDESQSKQTAGWRECNINVLTKASAPYNECFGSYTLRGFTVKIEKGTKPEGVWVEPKEFAPFLPTLQSEPQTGDVF